jgi:hypothetical protein
MEYAIAALLFGAIVVFVVPFGTNLLNQVVPASVSGNVLVQILLAGTVVVVAVIAAHHLGLSKYLRKAE